MIPRQETLISAFSQKPPNMSLNYGDTRDSLANRRNFLEGLGIDYRKLVCAKQVHGCRIKYVQESDIGKGALSYETAIADTDALVTDKKDIPLAIFTADCLPVFIYDPGSVSIGLVHSGWRSSKENIVAKTIKLMQDKFDTQPKNLSIGFGPAIRDCCYKVTPQFHGYFDIGLTKRRGSDYLDLIQVNKKQLLALGVEAGHIFDCGICTSCSSKNFFSYRKDGPACGRMMAVMMLK